MLVELSVVAGNDFTGQFMRDGLLEQLDIRGRRGVENIAGWLRHYKCVENHPLLAAEMVCVLSVYLIILPKLGILVPMGLENIVEWLRHYKCVENHPLLGTEMVCVLFDYTTIDLI